MMNNVKGKGKETADKDEPTSALSATTQQPSMLSRVVESAIGLGRSALATPSGRELSEHTAGALAASGKGQPLSRSGQSIISTEGGPSLQPSENAAAGSASLRSAHKEEHIRQSEKQFSEFLDETESLTPSRGLSDGHSTSHDFENAWTQANEFKVLPIANRSVAEQEARDGEDVLSLLSDSTIGDERFTAELEESEEYDWGLSPEQLSQLKAITAELMPLPEVHGHVAIDNPLNLVPVQTGSAMQLMGGGGPAAMEHWMQQWEGILSSYTDEVWGGLLPLVKEARKEVEALKERTPESRETKALRRLGAILGHIRRG